MVKSVWFTSLYGLVNRSPAGSSDCRQRARRGRCCFLDADFLIRNWNKIL